MTSKEERKTSLAEDRSRHTFDHPPPPPANCSKPLTPFSIEDILKEAPLKRDYGACGESAHVPSAARGLTRHAVPLPKKGLFCQASPLCALQELASKTFKGLEMSVLQAAEGRDGTPVFGQRNAPKRRRKSRTAFTNHQIYELEKRFLYQKYLSPADRDQIAQQLGLSNAQVITWFQNRRAKLKRDLEEMKADVESTKTVGSVPFRKIRELQTCVSRSLGDARPEIPALARSDDEAVPTGQTSPSSSFTDYTSKESSEEEEIDVDD